MLTGNNDLWACMDDGADFDLQSDACIRIATLNDKADPVVHPEGAEWTGGIVDATGTRFYVSIPAQGQRPRHDSRLRITVPGFTGWK
jgi:hypothetical protein